MRLYLIALQFLTILPVPVDTRCNKEDLGPATACFPLVGITVGGFLALTDLLLASLLPRPLTDALLVTLLTVITGALHLDGLADVCDGLAARGSRERFLEIMKDSRVGAVGAVGLVLGILLKWQALTAVPVQLKLPILLLFPALSRFAMVVAMTGSRHARQDGLGAAFIQGVGPFPTMAATGMTAAAAVAGAGLSGLAAMAAVAGLALAIRGYFHRRLDGITGDILGCTNELAEITGLVFLLACR